MCEKATKVSIYLTVEGRNELRALALLHELYRDQFFGRRGRPEVMAPHASKQPGSPAYSARSIVACSIAAGILATDISDRAT
jgi:hypothetical protein